MLEPNVVKNCKQLTQIDSNSKLLIPQYQPKLFLKTLKAEIVALPRPVVHTEVLTSTNPY